MTEAEDATVAATACSSPCRASHTSSDNIEGDCDEHFGFFVSLAQQPESEEVDDGVVDEESLIEYADQHGDPEKADVHVGIFSAGATSFGHEMVAKAPPILPLSHLLESERVSAASVGPLEAPAAAAAAASSQGGIQMASPTALFVIAIVAAYCSDLFFGENSTPSSARSSSAVMSPSDAESLPRASGRSSYGDGSNLTASIVIPA
ncbi:hypothetical protein FOZ61_008370 [Perkinsus olseni]|uniref:Uncharacterized protein n=1 Tax=Perkinsus olseni TaxID=32597 RepID=A0A7J6M7H0_PEROL|nr:hypothetical protein FOZ61_008370 [Perkinsus olseni]